MPEFEAKADNSPAAQQTAILAGVQQQIKAQFGEEMTKLQASMADVFKEVGYAPAQPFRYGT
jgi:hypothetical protein